MGHAVLMAKDLVGNEPFAVLLADDVIDSDVPCLKQMMDVFDETQCSVIATQVVEGPAISAYGVLDATPVPGCDGRLFEIRDLVEKPSLKRRHRTWRSSAATSLRRVSSSAWRRSHQGRRRRTATDRRHAGAAQARKNLRLPTLRANATMPATNSAF